MAYFPSRWLDIGCKCLEGIRFKLPSCSLGSIGSKRVRSFDDREIMAIFLQRAERILFQIFFFDRISIAYQNSKFRRTLKVIAEFFVVFFLQLFRRGLFNFVKLPDDDELFRGKHGVFGGFRYEFA